MKRVIFVGNYKTDGILSAPTKVGKELFNQFRKINDRTLFFSYFQDGNKYNLIKKLFGNKRISEGIFKFGLFPFLSRTIKERPDIVFAVTPGIFYLPILLLKRIFGIKFVYLNHSIKKNHIDSCKKSTDDRRALIIENIVTKFGDILLTLSNREKYLINTLYKISKEKIKVVDIGFNEFNVRKKEYFLDSVLKVCFIGFPDNRVKSFDTLFNSLSTSNLKIKLSIYTYNNPLKKFISKNQNIEIQYFSFCEEDLRVELAKNDLFICSSIYESFSLSLLEAMSVGLPFISTNFVGITERFNSKILKRQLVAPNNCDELKQKINEFSLMDKEEISKLGDECVKFANNYTWNRVAKSIYKIL